ncbi:unnamed protein product [Dicrocoelium dendriticum]|nr:unnamed protein product [Dicrocoelium dendriticum]
MAHLERTASIQSDATDFTAAEPLGPAFRSTPNEFFRRKSSVQRAQFGTMWQMEANTVTAGNSGDSFHEDSGLSSLRDAPEVESEVELESNIGSPYSHKMTDNSAELMKKARRSTHRQASVAEVSACEQDPHAVSVSMHGAPVERRMVSQAGSTGQPKTYGPVASKAAPVDEKLRIFRVMLAGDSAVGKTSLLLRLCDNAFNGKTVSTIGIDMKMRRITVDGRSTVLQLWDTAGQERFRSISASFYRKADGILLVYDCTSEASFLNTREWLSTIQVT